MIVWEPIPRALPEVNFVWIFLSPKLEIIADTDAGLDVLLDFWREAVDAAFGLAGCLPGFLNPLELEENWGRKS